MNFIPIKKLIIQAAIKTATDEETRKRLLFLILSLTISSLLLIALTFYIISTPLQTISTFFNIPDLAKITEVRKTYGFNQTFEANDPNYLESIGSNYEGVLINDSIVPITYFNQADKRWAQLPYGKIGTIIILLYLRELKPLVYKWSLVHIISLKK